MREKKGFTFVQSGNYAAPETQTVFSISSPSKRKNRRTHRIPRRAKTCTENSNGYGKAHAHLTVHAATHHAVAEKLMHNALQKKNSHSRLICLYHRSDPLSTVFFMFRGKNTLHKFSPFRCSITSMRLRIIPIQQLYGIVPASEGRKSI